VRPAQHRGRLPSPRQRPPAALSPLIFRGAAGSADELRTALRVVLAWGELEQPAIAEPLALLDRVLAMLWRLTH
ncbi:MAG: hypothetical protein AB1486_31065, partial [Planctomycetota bacterium]